MTDPLALVQERLARNSWGLLGTQGYVLGIDLGGYGLRAHLVDLQHHTMCSTSAEMSSTDPQELVDATLGLCRDLLQQQNVTLDRLVRIGIGFGAPVDFRTGTVLFSPRMPGWERFPLKERFEQTFDAVTLVDNDANLIALGEATFGVGRDVDNLFYLHLSSGVGGGMVLNGTLYHGATSTAGEIGHAVMGMGWDGVGQPATLEERVSIAGLLHRADQLGLQTDDLEVLFADDDVGRRVVNETVQNLSIRLAQLVALLDPQMIVLGGIVVRLGGDAFVEAISTQMQQFIKPQLTRPVQVVSSVLGHDSIAIGAIARALESLQE